MAYKQLVSELHEIRASLGYNQRRIGKVIRGLNVSIAKEDDMDTQDDELLFSFVHSKCTMQKKDDNIFGTLRKVSASELYRCFLAWCLQEGLPQQSQKWFGHRMATRFKRRKSNGRIYYIGISIKDSGED